MTGGHFFLFTVLVSLSITHSLGNQEILQVCKNNVKLMQEKLDRLKEVFRQRTIIHYDGMRAFDDQLDPLVKENRIYAQLLPDHIGAKLNKYTDKVMASIEATKDDVDDKIMNLRAEFAEQEKELEQQRKIIKWIEEN